MKRGKFFLIGFFLVLFTLVSCRNIEDGSGTKEKPLVYASFFPIYDLTKMIAADDVELKSFMPTSATVHDWQPTPRDIKRLSEADLLIINGANAERWVDKVQENLPDLNIVRLSDNVDLISYTGAASLGDFQLMTRYDFKDKTNNILFGHTHEEYLRLVFKKDDGTMSQDELVNLGKKLMEDVGVEVHQDTNLDIEDEKVYRVKMRHESGELHYELPEAGKWIVFADRLPEDILSYKFVDLDDKELEGTELLRGSSQGVDKITYDPHSWLSLNNAKAYLNTIAREITKLVPNKKFMIDSRRFNAVDTLNLMQNEFRDKFKELDKREFIVIHYAFQYLARDLNLVQYPLQGLTSIDDPSIRSMVRAIDYAKKAGIKTIFTEYGAPKSIARVIAEELDGGKVSSLASMEYALPGVGIDSMSYIDLMRMNLENLYEELSDE